jgi:hypothetical protein
MSSDADYAAFLDKANQDTDSAETKDASQKKSYGTKSVNTAVPKVLEQVEEYYISDSDEPFEPVALEFEGASVSAGRNPATFTCTAMKGLASCDTKLTYTHRRSQETSWKRQRRGGQRHRLRKPIQKGH